MVLVQHGDREAYAQLFTRWKAPIWSFLVRRTRDREASSELLQEVWLRVWRAAGTWQAGHAFKPWLYRVASNLCRDRFRTQQREVETVEIDLSRTGGRHQDPIAAVDLDRALEQLPDSLREAFVLGAIHGLDHNELGAALDITPVNARARVSRARALLRELLARVEA